MFNHRDIWSGLDHLAARSNISISALAKRAGLDPTTFNKSKRYSHDGKARWPSTESLSKVLAVMNVDIEDFAQMVMHRSGQTLGSAVPLIGLAQAGDEGFFDDAGFPVGTGWDEVRVPGLSGENNYALEIIGDSMHPVLRDGDRVIVSPSEDVRRGDRVVVKTLSGEVMAKELVRMTEKRIELASLNPEYANRSLDRFEVLWIARIVWVSQ